LHACKDFSNKIAAKKSKEMQNNSGLSIHDQNKLLRRFYTQIVYRIFNIWAL